jgi:hypothetical protein
MSVIAILVLLGIHFVADFVLQSDWMATNKSTNWRALLLHVGVYTCPFLVCYGLPFAAVTAVLHMCTDAVTSRITSYFWKREQRHWFFVVIGLDQWIHAVCLFAVYAWLVQR